VRVHVNLDGGVHTDDTKTSDDLGVVGNGLRAENELVVVFVPVVVEPLETIGGETDGGCSGKVKVARVEEVEEGVLEDFGPDGKVGEAGLALGKTTNDGVGDVTDSGLERKETRGKTALDCIYIRNLYND
jgi:hypothetical protein